MGIVTVLQVASCRWSGQRPRPLPGIDSLDGSRPQRTDQCVPPPPPTSRPDFTTPTFRAGCQAYIVEKKILGQPTQPEKITPALASSPQSTDGGGRPLLTSAMAAEEATHGAQQEDGSRGYTVSTNNGDALALKPAPTITVYTHLCTSHQASLCTLVHSLNVALQDLCRFSLQAHSSPSVKCLLVDTKGHSGTSDLDDARFTTTPAGASRRIGGPAADVINTSLIQMPTPPSNLLFRYYH